MNKFKRVAKAATLVLISVLFAQCAGQGAKEAEAPASAASNGTSTTLKIASVDGDSLMNGYNFAKDVNEAMLRGQSKLESAQRQKANEIQRFAGEIERKYKSNGYLTEASFNADQQKLQKMQGDAQNYMANLQRSVENELLMNTQQLNDSVDKYIAEYAKAKGYSMILRKAATWYVGDVDDVTADIIKGLNERYVKVDTKK